MPIIKKMMRCADDKVASQTLTKLVKLYFILNSYLRIKLECLFLARILQPSLMFASEAKFTLKTKKVLICVCYFGRLCVVSIDILT